MEKKLELTAESRPYIDKQTGQPKSFMIFNVKVNGITLQLRPADRTAQAILEQYFGSAN